MKYQWDLAIALHNTTGQLVRPYYKENAAANYKAATAHYEAWRSIKMMTDHDTQEHGTEQALARASQGGHTIKYTNLVLEILPKEDVSSTIMETNNLTGQQTFERIGAIILEHKTK